MPLAATDESLQALVDGLPCGWLRIDQGGRILQANQALARLLGQAEPPRGQAFDELLTLPSRVVYQSYLLPLLHLSGETAELNLSLRQPEGRPPLDVLLYSGPAPGAPGQVDVVLVPIRQRRRIEDELARVKRAADQSPIMVFQLESLGGEPLRFSYASQSVRQLYGCTPEAAGASAAVVLGRYPGPEADALRAALAEAAVAGRACRVLCMLAGAEGEPTRHHEWLASPRPGADGRTLWHGYVADVTERLALEREAARREAAEQSARLRKEFLSRASHELRTPLNAILGFAQLLGLGDTSALRPEQRQALDILQSAGRHMLALVNQLLDLSRVEGAAQPLALGPQPVAAMLQDLAATWGASAAQRGQALTLQLHPALPAGAQVRAEAVALRQALGNLLSNALKYSPPGARVTLFAQPGADGRIALGVADEGPGLSAEQQAHLFEPFNRLGAEHGATEGTGLGLVVCRQLVLALGGRLELESQPGRGSRFWVELESARPAAAPPPVLPPTRAAARGRVFYVEDNEVNVLLMQAIAAQRPGIGLQVARSGRDAEQQAAQAAAAPDLLLLDRHLPDTQGERLLARLRQRPGWAAVPAVLVTAAADEADEPPPAGFAARWLKPLDVEHTLRELDQLLSGA